MSYILGIFGAFLLLGMLGLTIVIQVLLCKLKSGLPGLILPSILFMLGFITSLASLASMVLFPLIVFILPGSILIIVYIGIRRNHKQPISDELRHMRAQDL